jgi:hypothetical protein
MVYLGILLLISAGLIPRSLLRSVEMYDTRNRKEIQEATPTTINIAI